MNNAAFSHKYKPERTDNLADRIIPAYLVSKAWLIISNFAIICLDFSISSFKIRKREEGLLQRVEATELAECWQFWFPDRLRQKIAGWVLETPGEFVPSDEVLILLDVIHSGLRLITVCVVMIPLVHPVKHGDCNCPRECEDCDHWTSNWEWAIVACSTPVELCDIVHKSRW